MGVILASSLLAGCHVIDQSQEEQKSAQSPLSPLRPGIDAVQLDVVYIERDAEDSLLKSIVWDEIDQVGTVDLKTRSRLRESGFRVGMVGMTPPRTMQRLLGIRSEITDVAGTSLHKEMIGRSVSLSSGGETEIQTSSFYNEIEIQLPGEKEPRKFYNARFVIQVKLERLQDGWVKLHLTPEIHHGNLQLRPKAGPTQWGLNGGQVVEKLQDLYFHVTLNVGEMVVISADHTVETTLGDQFFVNRDCQRPQRRMVVIRLSDMKKLEPLYRK